MLSQVKFKQAFLLFVGCLFIPAFASANKAAQDHAEFEAYYQQYGLAEANALIHKLNPDEIKKVQLNVSSLREFTKKSFPGTPYDVFAIKGSAYLIGLYFEVKEQNFVRAKEFYSFAEGRKGYNSCQGLLDLRITYLDEHGLGGRTADPNLVFQKYRLASNSGSHLAKFRLAIAHEYGELGQVVNRSEAYRLYQEIIRPNDAIASVSPLAWDTEKLARFSDLYPPGTHTQMAEGLFQAGWTNQEHSPELAFKNFKAAADLGHAKAQNTVGLCYLSGVLGKAIDFAKAVEYIRKAADQNDPVAIYNLGTWYQSGNRGVEKDLNRARELYEKASHLGNPSAKISLALFHENGSGGLPKDPARGLQLLEEAARGGSANGLLSLGEVYRSGRYGKPVDHEQAITLFKEAAQKRNSLASFYLGEYSEFGTGGVEINPALAFKYYQNATLGFQPWQQAFFVLGRHYKNGTLGLTQNFPEARRLLERALEFRMPKAKAELEELELLELLAGTAPASSEPPFEAQLEELAQTSAVSESLVLPLPLPLPLELDSAPTQTVESKKRASPDSEVFRPSPKIAMIPAAASTPGPQELPTTPQTSPLEAWISPAITLRAGDPNAHIPFANSFKRPEDRRVRQPVPQSTASQTQVYSSFHFKPVSQIPLLPLEQAHSFESPVQVSGFFEGIYSSSLYFEEPTAQDQVTFVLAGRGTKASVPEDLFGKTVMILGPNQADLKPFFMERGIDTFVIQKLRFHGRELSPDKIGLVTPRRLVAMGLARAFKLRGFSMVDDNIGEIRMSQELSQYSNWDKLYSKMTQALDQNGLAVLGLKEKHQQHLDSLQASEWEVVDQLESGKASGFGQKVFFFKLNSLVEATSGVFESLFPPRVEMAQEDLYFQLYLAAKGQKVSHAHRNSIEFERSDPQSLAKPMLQSLGSVADEWEGEAQRERNPTRKQIAELIAGEVRYDRLATERANEKARNADPIEVQRKLNEAASRKRAAPESVEPRLVVVPAAATASAKYARPSKEDWPEEFSFGSFDPVRSDQADHWDDLVGEITRVLFTPRNLPFRNPQRIALEKLVQLIEQKKHAPQNHMANFNMATGIGKTEIFLEIALAASHSLQGNVAVILPTQVVKAQTLERLKGQLPNGHVIQVSSAPGDQTAEYVANLVKIKEGKHLIVFCEDSFSNFLRYKTNRFGNLSDFSLVILDEWHMLDPKTRKMIGSLPEQGLVLGFSATPKKKGLGPELYHYSMMDGVEEDILAPWTTRSIQVQEKEFLQLLPKILSEEEHPNGGKLKDHPGLIFLRKDAKIETAKDLVTLLNQFDLKAEAFHSGLSYQQKEKILNDFKNGTLKKLVAINTLREGFNEPSVDHVILAQENLRDEKDIIQTLGRSLRLRGAHDPKISLLVTINKEIANQFQMTLELQRRFLSGVSSEFSNQQRDKVYSLSEMEDGEIVSQWH